MIISRTPVRVSFFGGGTDYPGFYEEYGGEVLSATINHYVYVTVNKLNPFFDHRIHVGYSRSELVNEVDDLQHPSVRSCLKHHSITDGVEIFAMSDLPARTGLGSSSAFTVGLLHSLHAFQNRLVTKEALAREAIFVEQCIINERVGSQDQVATTFGGMNNIHFGKDFQFRVDLLPLHPLRKKLLNSNLMLFFTSISRSANEILEEQCRKVQINVANLKIMKEQVREGIKILTDSNRDLREFGELLHQGWMIKRSLSSQISNNFIDSAYEKARKLGAIGGKLLGAGGGGFLLLFVPPENQQFVKDNLPELMHVPFSFEEEGSRIIYFC